MVYLSVGCGGVMFANWFVSPLVGCYVWYWVCLFVGWWLCDSIISLTLGMVSVLNFFITDLNQSHFKLQMGRLFFSMWHSVLCITMGYLFHVWGGVGVGLFCVCVVISICTELLCFGRGI